MTAVEYIQSLERKVEELEGLLDRDSSRAREEVSTPPTPPSVQDDKAWCASPARSSPPKLRKASTSVDALPSKSSTSENDEDVIETMVGATEEYSPRSGSFERYRGSFAGLSLLRRVQNLCKHVSATRRNTDADALQEDFIQAFDFASPDSDSSIPWNAFVMLPSKESFDRAIDVVSNQACCNVQFLMDRPALEDIARQVYAASEGEPRHQSRKPLALLYAILALSRRFEPVTSGEAASAQNIRGYEGFIFRQLL